MVVKEMEWNSKIHIHIYKNKFLAMFYKHHNPLLHTILQTIQYDSYSDFLSTMLNLQVLLSLCYI